MKMYDYLISYNFEADGYLTHCSGTIQISRKKKITTFDDINYVTNFIIKRLSETYTGIKNLSIYNIIFLGRNKH